MCLHAYPEATWPRYYLAQGAPHGLLYQSSIILDPILPACPSESGLIVFVFCEIALCACGGNWTHCTSPRSRQKDWSSEGEMNPIFRLMWDQCVLVSVSPCWSLRNQISHPKEHWIHTHSHTHTSDLQGHFIMSVVRFKFQKWRCIFCLFIFFL